MSIEGLRKQVDALAKELPKARPNVLHDPDWPAMRALILREAVNWPEAAAALQQSLDRLEAKGRSDWRTLRQAIYEPLQPFLEARIVIAEALMQEQKRRPPLSAFE